MTGMVSADDIAPLRERFFDYFRARLQTISRDDLAVPDRVILSATCLDALAKHWHSTTDTYHATANIKGDERLRLFLLKHGGHPAFDRISAPLVRNATGREIGHFPFKSYRAGSLNEVTNWENDPTMEEIADIVDMQPLCRRWSYAAIFYIDLRCAAVHNFAAEKEDIKIVESNTFDRAEPFYRFAVFTAREPKFLMIIPVQFLAETLGRAIESFQHEAASRNIVPFRT